MALIPTTWNLLQRSDLSKPRKELRRDVWKLTSKVVGMAPGGTMFIINNGRCQSRASNSHSLRRDYRTTLRKPGSLLVAFCWYANSLTHTHTFDNRSL